MNSRSTREDPLITPPRRRRTVGAPKIVVGGMGKLPLDGLDDHPSPARVGRPPSDRPPDTSAGFTSLRSTVPRVQQRATPPNMLPRLPREDVDPFTLMGSRSGKSTPAVSVSMAQQRAQDACASPQTLAKPRPLYSPPTPSASTSGRHSLSAARASPAAPLSLTPRKTPTSGSASQAGSSATATSRIAQRAPIAVNTSTTALLTPPPSDRRKPSSRSSARRPIAEEDEDAGSGGYLPTPTKTPLSGQRSASSSGQSFPWHRPRNFEVKQEERLPAPNFLATGTGLITPEPSPVKQKNPHISSTSTPLVVPGNIFANQTLFQRPPPAPRTLFRTIALYECIIQSMPREVILLNGEPFLTYKCKNGHTLKWFQAQDLEILVAEAVSREVMKLDGNDNWVMVAQGKILHYQMGLGKTHVACLVVVEVLQQLKVVYEERGLQLSPKPVLVIADKSLQPQWKKHFEDLAGDSSKVTVYEKGNTPMPRADVIICNIVIFRNQYDRYLQHWEMREEAYAKNPVGTRPDRSKPTADDLRILAKSAPFFVNTFRYMVIDEFHLAIANAHTISSRSVLTVKADHVLLVSGTPAQNKLDDLNVPFALLLHSSRRKSFRETEAANRRANKGLEAKRKKDMRNGDVVDRVEVNNMFIAQTTITRLNKTGVPGEEPLIDLPHRTDYLVTVNLTEGERVLYEHMEEHTYRFVKLTRTRQVPLHPNLVRGAFQRLYGYGEEDETQGELDLKDLGEDVTEEFKIEVDDVDLPEICIHRVDDTKSAEPKKDRNALPPQAAALGVDEIMDDEYLSSRFRVVLGILSAVWRERSEEKVIIFSTFTSLLKLLGDCLDERDIAHIKYTGTMNSKDRQEALETIAEDDEVKVMLVSMKAGGVGLNITAANNVIILDPWWNPYVEEQAVSRVHRQGQTRDVYVFRIISPNTIETRIKEIQDGKREVVDGYTERCVGVMRRRLAGTVVGK